MQRFTLPPPARIETILIVKGRWMREEGVCQSWRVVIRDTKDPRVGNVAKLLRGSNFLFILFILSLDKESFIIKDIVCLWMRPRLHHHHYHTTVLFLTPHVAKTANQPSCLFDIHFVHFLLPYLCVPHYGGWPLLTTPKRFLVSSFTAFHSFKLN